MAQVQPNRPVTMSGVGTVKANRRLVKCRQHDLLCPRWEAKAWLGPALKRNVLRRDLARRRFQSALLPVGGLERQGRVRSLGRIPIRFRTQT